MVNKCNIGLKHSDDFRSNRSRVFNIRKDFFLFNESCSEFLNDKIFVINIKKHYPFIRLSSLKILGKNSQKYYISKYALWISRTAYNNGIYYIPIFSLYVLSSSQCKKLLFFFRTPTTIF